MKNKVLVWIFRIAFAVYMYIVFYITLIDRIVGQRRHMLILFWEYKRLIDTRSIYWAGQIGGNILMLIPFGFIIPVISRHINSLLTVVFSGFLLSVFIETTQYFTGRGLFEFDDMFNNTLGAFTGYIIYILIFRRQKNKDG